MLGKKAGQPVALDQVVHLATQVQSAEELAQLLRALRRRHARNRQEAELTYRELAARAGWSHAAIAEYMSGRTLPPTDRLDILLGLLGATRAEQGAVATARDRLEEQRRGGHKPGVSSGSEASGSTQGSKADGARPTTPRQLPAAPLHFVGRTAELAVLTGLADRRLEFSTLMICAITGPAGVGKTSLAVHWAHRVADDFPDGQLYVDLRGFDPTGSPVDPAQALRGLLEILGTPPQRIPLDLEAQTKLYRSLLAGRRMLIVLDNARDVAQLRPLLPGSAGCVVLVTSRHRLPGLIAAYGAHSLTLDLFSSAEARQMLDARLGADRAGHEPVAIGNIIESCGRLPLALAVTAANAAAHPQLPLQAFAAQLHQAHRRLDALSTGDMPTDLRTVISYSFHALSPEPARLFRLLSLHPGPDIDAAAAAALAALPIAQAEVALGELTRANLIVERDARRYTMHDLLRIYAYEQAHAVDSGDGCAEAIRRMLDHYLLLAPAADRLIHPTRTSVFPPAPNDFFLGYDEALHWLISERAVLVAMVGFAAQHGFHDHAWRLAWTLTTVLNRRGYWHDWLTVHRVALEAIQGGSHGAVEAIVHCELARACIFTGDLGSGRTHIAKAREIFQLNADGVGLAEVHSLLASVSNGQRDFVTAIDHAKTALRFYRENHHLAGQARILNNLGWYHSQLDQFRLGIGYCVRAIVINHRIGQRNNQAASWDSLGYAYHRLDDHRKAIACFTRALEIWQDLNNQYEHAITLIHLGDARHATGEPSLAEAAWHRGLALLDELNHPRAEDFREHIHNARNQLRLQISSGTPPC